jgi:hypothetical protein
MPKSEENGFFRAADFVVHHIVYGNHKRFFIKQWHVKVREVNKIQAVFV